MVAFGVEQVVAFERNTHTLSVLTAAGWKTESFGFRETFLQHFTQPGHATALTLISIMLFDYAMESARHWPDTGESATRREVTSAAADLRWLAGYLAAVGREKEQSSLDPADQALSDLAGRQAAEVLRIAEVLQRAAGEP